MKKTFYIILLGLLGLVGFTRADINSMSVTPTTQSAISGSLVTFTVTGTNGSGDMYLKYVLPITAGLDVAYQNASILPLNNALLSLGAEHDPVFLIAANSNFSVTITAKVITSIRDLPTMSTIAQFAADTQFSTILTSAIAQITPIADLRITNILTGANPVFSGDMVSYYITLQNIGSSLASGINFISTFPIPTLSTPTATFNAVPYVYSYITYPQDFVWSGSYLDTLIPGQTTTIILTAHMTQAFPVGTPFNQIAKTTTLSTEYTTGNNSATATGIVAGMPDLWVRKALITPYPSFSGDAVNFLITYGNSGLAAATSGMLIDILSGQISWSAFGASGAGQGSASVFLGNIPVGSGGSIIMTGYLNGNYPASTIFRNTVSISTPDREMSTGNNFASTGGYVIDNHTTSIDIFANNITRPAMDTIPYGSGAQIMIQAVSGDTVRLTMNYINTGNSPCIGATVSLSGLNGFVSSTPLNGNVGTLPAGSGGTRIITGIVGPRNFISFVPTAKITCNESGASTDSVRITEPFVCGDGLLTRNEPCDTAGNIGVLFSGQICENQQGICVLRTENIINTACIDYQYTNALGVTTTGRDCSSVTLPMTNAACSSMTGAAPTTNGNGYTVDLTCKGINTTATTPITIDCANGTTIGGTGAMFHGVCHYTGGFVGVAQCRVGNDVNNPACRVPVSLNAGQCKSLEALDGTVAIVDGDNYAESRFRCETTNGHTAQSLVIDCGNNTQHTASNASVLTALCKYNEPNTPRNYTVKCIVDGVDTPICQSPLIVDESSLGYCGDGVRQGYEDCDDGDLNGTSQSSCSEGCDLGGAMVGCFSVGNTSISIQKGEILPFRWTLDQTNNIINGNTCDGKPDGSIPRDSINCTFNIYNGEQPESDGTPVFTTTRKCKDNIRGNDALFQYFISKGWRSLTHSFGRYYIDSDEFVDDVFGEYKVSLDRVDYQYCRSDDKTEGTAIDRVCNVDFAVTQQYLVQKSSFGLTPKAVTIPLEGYKMINGDDLIDSTDLADIMVLNESDYNGGNSVASMMNAFINKYGKLAVKYGTILSDEGNTITTYKVPGQDIVVFKGNGTLTYTDGASKTKPFTIIVDGPNIKINGSIANTNAMFLLNQGDITFLPPADACTKTQVIKGIFVTNQGSFLAGPDLANTSTNKAWCSYGGLKVQGILIGNGIEDLVQSRRSQLNGWFYTASSSETAIKAERRNEIFNGASVLIEYSPSLWNALPPGASEFTKALDIYKQ